MNPGAALAWAASVHGHPVEVASERRGDNTTTWGLRSRAGQLVLKGYGPGRGFQQERHALQQWAPRLPCATPRLLAADPQRRLLALTHLPGAPVTDVHLGAAAQQAGRVLRELHALPVHGTVDPIPLDAACRRRFEASLRRARPHVSAASHTTARELLKAADLDGARRVPCHRDFGPHNWLWLDGELGLVDFEHARPDHALSDWVKVLALPPAQRAVALPALATGHGSQPGPERTRVAFLVAFHLGTVAWQARRGDATALGTARAALERLLEISSDT